MDRRSLLALAGSAALSGCGATGIRGGPTGGDPTASRVSADESTTTVAAPTLAEQGVPPTICEETPDLGGITAVLEPAFAADWAGLEVSERYRRRGGLQDDATIVGLTSGDRSRAYPLAVLTIHEVVNDHLDGPLLVTYCPLCRSGMVAERRVGGEPTAFGVSGLLWRAPGVYAAASELDDRVFGVDARGAETGVRNTGNLVPYDTATGSFWSQILAQAICGPERGTELTIVPSTVATWGEWRRDHPGTDVLLPPPHSKADNPPLPASPVR